MVLVVGLAACSNGGDLRHRAEAPTTTGGAAARSSAQLAMVSFLSPQLGYGLVEDSDSEGGCSYQSTRLSREGAVSRDTAVVTQWPCGDLPPATELFFDSSGDGFAFNPNLFVTNDAGRHWHSQDLGGTVVAVQLVDAAIWAAVAVCQSGETTCPLKVLTSTDGGGHWQPLAAEPDLTTPGPIPSAQTAGNQTWLVATQSTTYLLARPNPNQAGVGDQAVGVLTRDGGRSWQGWRVPCLVDAGSVMVASAPDGWLGAVCSGQPEAGFQPKSVSVSSDGGETWGVLGPCSGANPGSASCVASPLSSGYLGQVASPRDGTIYDYGERSPLLVSTDAGRTWMTVPVVGNVNGEPFVISFLNPAIGYVLGELNTGRAPQTLWWTHDGGRTWVAVVGSSGVS